MYWTDIDLWKLIEIDKNPRKRWDFPKLTIPIFKVMLLYFSDIYINDI